MVVAFQIFFKKILKNKKHRFGFISSQTGPRQAEEEKIDLSPFVRAFPKKFQKNSKKIFKNKKIRPGYISSQNGLVRTEKEKNSFSFWVQFLPPWV